MCVLDRNKVIQLVGMFGANHVGSMYQHGFYLCPCAFGTYCCSCMFTSQVQLYNCFELYNILEKEDESNLLCMLFIMPHNVLKFEYGFGIVSGYEPNSGSITFKYWIDASCVAILF